MGSAKPVSIPKTVRLSHKPHEKPHTEPEDVVITMHERVKWDYPGDFVVVFETETFLIPGIFIPGTTSPALPAQTLSMIIVISTACISTASGTTPMRSSGLSGHVTVAEVANVSAVAQPELRTAFSCVFHGIEPMTHCARDSRIPESRRHKLVKAPRWCFDEI